MKHSTSYMAPMQRSLGIGLLVVFAYALVGLYPAQWALHGIARSEMWCSIREGSVEQARVVALSFPTTNGHVNDPRFTWEDDNEFLFNGAMYDVLGRIVGGGRITFHCIADKEEDTLISCAALLDPLSDIGNGISGKGHSVIRSVAKHYLGHDARLTPVLPDQRRSVPGTFSATVQDGFTRPVSRPPWA